MTDYLNLFEYTYFIHRIPAFMTNKDREISLQRKMYLADTGLLSVLGQVSSGQEIDFVLDQKIAIEVEEPLLRTI